MTIIDYIKQYAISSPNTLALKDRTYAITYKELLHCIKQYSFSIKNTICKPNDRVLLMVTNRQKWILVFLSLLYLDCWVVPISNELSKEEKNGIREDIKATAIITDKSVLSLGKTILEEGRTVYNTKGTGGILHMTSGSTGKPKFCIRTIEGLTAEGISYRETLDIHRDDKILGVPPFYHSYALGAACMAALASGACLYTVNRFIPREILKVSHNEKITIMILVPVMAKLLCDTYMPDELNLQSLRITLVGAGAISNELYLKFLDKFHIPLLSNYGSTETGGLISRLDATPFNSIGIPMKEVEIKIVNDSSENSSLEVECEQVGELWIKCKGIFTGYLNGDPPPFDENGFFSMGDIVRVDRKGLIYIIGRKKAFINIGGKKVYPTEVEQIILQLAQIKDCVVVGIKKTSGEEAVKAYIVGSDINEEDIRIFCSSKISSYKIPSVIQFVKELHRNELGKIKYEDLESGVYGK